MDSGVYNKEKAEQIMNLYEQCEDHARKAKAKICANYFSLEAQQNQLNECLKLQSFAKSDSSYATLNCQSFDNKMNRKDYTELSEYLIKKRPRGKKSKKGGRSFMGRTTFKSFSKRPGKKGSHDKIPNIIKSIKTNQNEDESQRNSHFNHEETEQNEDDYVDITYQELDGKIGPKETVYCFCNYISYGRMVKCDNESCPIQWFHFHCVGLQCLPKGKWFCSVKCRDEYEKSHKSA
ncbi:MAG: hypothetical protein MJ252_14750 [archaeon]|nr:hypothetical protein [archaeon]